MFSHIYVHSIAYEYTLMDSEGLGR